MTIMGSDDTRAFHKMENWIPVYGKTNRNLIVGGLAVAAHGYGRLTFDLDLVVQLQPDNVLRALKALGSLGHVPLVPVAAADFADPAKREAWIREKNAARIAGAIRAIGNAYRNERVCRT
jgi:hypothetical protein